MADYELSFIDERPELNVVVEENTLTFAVEGIQGPMGPAGTGGTGDLSDYATIEYVDTSIETIELTPGPQGLPGSDGLNVYSGVGAPAITARAGETYVDTTTGDVYEWTA